LWFVTGASKNWGAEGDGLARRHLINRQSLKKRNGEFSEASGGTSMERTPASNLSFCYEDLGAARRKGAIDRAVGPRISGRGLGTKILRPEMEKRGPVWLDSILGGGGGGREEVGKFAKFKTKQA